MLKVNFDAGRDHIAMFVPFVLDAVDSLDKSDFKAELVRRAVRDRHELTLPVNTVRTILGRLVKSGYLKREGGRWFRTDKSIDSQDLPRERSEVEARQQQLAGALRRFSVERWNVEINSDEDALALILQFLERYHVKLAFEESPEASSGENTDEEASEELITAMFLRDTIVAEGELADVLQEMLEGYVLQNALLLKDISSAARQFDHLHVVFDSQLLFSALGLRGPAMETATTELTQLLRDTGASLDVFEQTIAEMRRILAVYEEKIGTSQGRLSLHSTDLTRHLLSKRYSPSDVRQEAALLEIRVAKLGFNLREVPERKAQFTLDEGALCKQLSDEPGRERAPRVLHDADCIAGVLMYRAGHVADSIDSARAVFVSSGGMTVDTVRSWYFKEGGRGFPPIVHVIALSNYAWLKRPASASKLKVHELMALCSAALRPDAETWQRFIAYLKQLEESGELSAEEVTAIVASDLTENVLAERGIDPESDADSLAEVVERVKVEYKVEADTAIEDAVKFRTRVDQRIGLLAVWSTWIIMIALLVSFVLGAGLSIYYAASGGAASLPALLLAIGPLGVFGVVSLWNGFHLKGWRERAEQRMVEAVQAWLGSDSRT